MIQYIQIMGPLDIKPQGAFQPKGKPTMFFQVSVAGAFYRGKHTADPDQSTETSISDTAIRATELAHLAELNHQ